MAERVIHRAKFINHKGQVSPLCREVPRALNMKKESWVSAPENNGSITCKRCRKKLNLEH